MSEITQFSYLTIKVKTTKNWYQTVVKNWKVCHKLLSKNLSNWFIKLKLFYPFMRLSRTAWLRFCKMFFKILSIHEEISNNEFVAQLLMVNAPRWLFARREGVSFFGMHACFNDLVKSTMAFFMVLCMFVFGEYLVCGSFDSFFSLNNDQRKHAISCEKG